VESVEVICYLGMQVNTMWLPLYPMDGYNIASHGVHLTQSTSLTQKVSRRWPIGVPGLRQTAENCATWICAGPPRIQLDTADSELRQGISEPMGREPSELLTILIELIRLKVAGVVFVKLLRHTAKSAR